MLTSSLLFLLACSANAGLIPGASYSSHLTLRDSAVCASGTSTVNERICTIQCGVDRSAGDYNSVQVSSVQECANACSADAQCTTAQFSEANGFCYLKNQRNPSVSATGIDTVDCYPQGVTTTTSSATSVATCAAAVQTINSRKCTTSCNTDRSGGDYSSVKAGSIASCAQICAADSKCLTAQYNEGNGFCYLKSSRNPSTSTTGTDTIDCEPKGYTTTSAPPAASCAATQIVNNRQCQVTCGQDRSGGDYNSKQATSATDCMAICAADIKCVTAQYSAANGFCYMKSLSNPWVPNSDTTTVDCGPKLPGNYACLNITGAFGGKGNYEVAMYTAQTAELYQQSTWDKMGPIINSGFAANTYVYDASWPACQAASACAAQSYQIYGHRRAFDLHQITNSGNLWQCTIYRDVPGANIAPFFGYSSWAGYAYGYRALCNQPDGTVGPKCDP